MAWIRESVIALVALFATCAPFVVLLIRRKRQNIQQMRTCPLHMTCNEGENADSEHIVGDADIERASHPASQPLHTRSDFANETPSQSGSAFRGDQLHSGYDYANVLCAQIAVQLVVLPGGNMYVAGDTSTPDR